MRFQITRSVIFSISIFAILTLVSQVLLQKMQDAHAVVTELTPDNISDTLSSNGRILVMFLDDTCPHCQAMWEPYWKLSEQYGNTVPFTYANVRVYESLQNDYNVHEWPTFVLFDNGQEVDRIHGEDQDKLDSFVQGVINDQGQSSDDQGQSSDDQGQSSDDQGQSSDDQGSDNSSTGTCGTVSSSALMMDNSNAYRIIPTQSTSCSEPPDENPTH
jgi:thioredoxin-like negative regulator of GroEL